jgi:nucleoside-diphosphate-sugar epimerase
MKILVTGGGGFLGRHIVRMLMKQGHEVVAYQRSGQPDMEGYGVEVQQGSLLESEPLRAALRGCDAVIHTAAKAGVWGSRRDYFATNLEGTRHLLRLMEEAGIRKLVHCSTPSVVFDGGSHEGADESLPYGRNWLCHYAESKAQAEAEAIAWGRTGKGRVIALRPHLIWGIGDPHLLPKVIERSRDGRLRIIGDGRNRVDITRVENAAAAHLLALNALDDPNAVNRPYFLSQGEPVILWDWINQLLEKVRVDPIRRRVPFKVAYGLGWACEWIWRLGRREEIPPMTRFVAVELASSHWFSIDAARRRLGYRPENYSIAGGLDRYARHWLSSTDGGSLS